MGTTFFGYRWYKLHQEYKAQHLMEQCVLEYQKALANNDLWPNVIELFEYAYVRCQGTSAAPFLKLYKIDAMSRGGNHEEALHEWDTLLQGLPDESSLRPLFSMKHVLMQLDSSLPEMQSVGLRFLHELAQDGQQMFSDHALFYLGCWYWDHDELQEAQTLWRRLEERVSQGNVNAQSLLQFVHYKTAYYIPHVDHEV